MSSHSVDDGDYHPDKRPTALSWGDESSCFPDWGCDKVPEAVKKREKNSLLLEEKHDIFE